MPKCRRSRFAASLAVAFGLLTASPAPAETAQAGLQLLLVGVSPEDGLDAGASPDLPAIAISGLPEAEQVRQEVFAARLRASAVSTFASDPSAEHPGFDQFFLVVAAALEATRDGYGVSLGAETFPVGEFAGRLGAAVGAFEPRHRRIGFLHLRDDSDSFPPALPELRVALDGLGFEMLVLMVAGQPMTGCPGGQALHYSLLAGLADRIPFGDGDGVSDVAEVERYLTAALARAKSRGCGPAYSLILKATDAADHALLTHGEAMPAVAGETKLYHETFEAKFLLESDDVSAMQAFLDSCVYCPDESRLLARLDAQREAARIAELETGIWERIKADDSRERLAIYLENCTLCTHREAALSRISEIDARTAAARLEAESFRAAAESHDLAGLRGYADTCMACTRLAEAERLISEIEADAAYRAERDLLDAAMAVSSAEKLQDYLETCRICDRRDEVSATLVKLEKMSALREPCLELAGLPQFGGPRKLEEIDRNRAMTVCRAAAEEFPEDGLLLTTLGRISQASGDFDAARTAYATAVEQQVPAAYGLAAYAHYAPQGGTAPDVLAAEKLALRGAEMGDWLSHEILTVMYSKDLVAGKTPRDAFVIAERVAEEGNPLAQFFVGYYYLTGTGTEVSEELAETWLSKAVEQGYTHAYSFLAELHERGTEGGAPRPDEAAALYWAALEMGDPTATDRLTTQLGDRNRDVVRIIQQRLREAGLYRGPVDGVPGRGTASAIREYADSVTGQG